MALTATYQSFLATINSALLAKDATLNYVTTLTSINDNAAIVKHLAAQQKMLKKKTEKVINSIESSNALCLDVETTIEFVSGGGAYLPGLDDNFLADRIVTLPVIHIVHFDEAGKIKQIRMHWDQGSLLKMVEVIGSRARNWPIKDGKDQIRLIKSNGTALDTHAGQAQGNSAGSRPQTASRDQHASLNLFAPREERQETDYGSSPPVAPRASARPPPRDYNDLFVGNDENAAPSLAAVANDRPASPTKGSAIAKGGAGAGKNYQRSRLFDNDENDPSGAPDPFSRGSPEKMRAPHPTKYNHFEFHDGHDEPQPTPKAAAAPRPKSKHASNWDFEDFTTPAKVAQRTRPHDVRHFELGDEPGRDAPDNTPAPRAAIHQPRRDAETHFEFRDDGEQKNPRRAGPGKGQGIAGGRAQLYANNLFNEQEDEHRSAPTGGKARADAAMSQKDRKKDFDPHFEMADKSSPAAHGAAGNKPLGHRKDMNAQWEATDASPARGAGAGGLGERSQSHINRNAGAGAGTTNNDNRAKAVKMMDAQWEATDNSPVTGAGGKGGKGARRDKENLGIKTGGDGMGGTKGKNRGWGIGDDSANEEDQDAPVGRTMQVGKSKAGQGTMKTDGFWDF